LMVCVMIAMMAMMMMMIYDSGYDGDEEKT
jgi:hypothetical protein